MAPNPDKAALRTRLLAIRDAAADLTAASAAVCSRLERLPELAGARVVAGYAALPAEVSVDPMVRQLLADGVVVCLPWVAGPDLILGQIEDLDTDLAPGWRGVREPLLGRRRPLRPTAVDVALVPGVGFDVAGNRLGYGGGHFDRLLPRLRRGAVAVGVCLDEQVVEALPVEAHDRPVDLIVTPTRTLRPPSGRL